MFCGSEDRASTGQPIDMIPKCEFVVTMQKDITCMVHKFRIKLPANDVPVVTPRRSRLENEYQPYQIDVDHFSLR